MRSRDGAFRSISGTPPAASLYLLSAERKPSFVGRSIHSVAESYRPESEASLAMDLVLCHYPTACGTMRDFPNSRRQAWFLVMCPGPVFVLAADRIVP